jgi:glycosyltransferase involved in cell wall biosynthesis
MVPRITVLLPNYNGARFLSDVFTSLVQQTFQDFRCIFLDDGSTDNSIEIANEFAAVVPDLEIRTYPNVGLGGNWNRGIELVETEFFALLHCDDAYEPQYLEKMLALMDQYQDAALGHCGAVTIDEESGNTVSLLEEYKQNRYLVADAFTHSRQIEYAQLLEGSYINCPSVFYRTAAVREIGLFNTDLKQVLDWDYWFRTVLAGYTICGTRQRMYRYRRHANNATVRNSEGFARYEEELGLLRSAHEQGLSEGLVRSRLNTAIVRNIVIFDIAEALQSGNINAADEKIGFLRDVGIADRLVLAGLRALTASGKFGGAVLGFVINIYVRISSKRYVRAVSW